MPFSSSLLVATSNATIVCILLLLRFSVNDACGVTTHNVIAHKAMRTFHSNSNPNFKEIMETHQNAFQNGAAFPDFGYSCPLNRWITDLPDASEAAHWPPFHVATVQYIKKNYPQPWSPETEKLVSFLFGMISHSVADIIWHDLGIIGRNTFQGFIQSLAETDCKKHTYLRKTINQNICS